jgi:hypothetical protein
MLVWIVLPLWALSGFLDYLCHRNSHIERASGATESLIHWLMLGEATLAVGLALFLKIDALVQSLLLVLLVAHEVTGYYDLRLAMSTRKVTIIEHQIHSALEILPLCALLLVMILHWPQTQALVGLGSEKADFTLGAKQPPRLSELLPPLAVFLLLAILPYVEELARGLRSGTLPRRAPEPQPGAILGRDPA